MRESEQKELRRKIKVGHLAAASKRTERERESAKRVRPTGREMGDLKVFNYSRRRSSYCLLCCVLVFYFAAIANRPVTY